MLNILDEALHLAGTQQMLKLWRNGTDDPEMAELYQELLPKARAIMLDAYQQEVEWSQYLFKDGSMLGLNHQILTGYLRHIIDKRLLAIGMEPEFDSPRNPIPWINSWLMSDSVQVAPQETEISTYMTGQVDSEVSTDAFAGFSL